MGSGQEGRQHHVDFDADGNPVSSSVNAYENILHVEFFDEYELSPELVEKANLALGASLENKRDMTP